MKYTKIAALIVLSLVLVICAIYFAVSAGRDESAGANKNDIVLDPDHTGNSTVTPEIASDSTSQNLSRRKIGWGQGTNKNEKNQPIDAVDAQNKYGHLGAIFIFPEEENTLYLTYDLGYENGNTEAIIDALNKRGVKGTFFITMDYAVEAPTIVQKIIDGGHTLGNHTTKHPSIPDVSEERIRKEIMDLHIYVQDHFNYVMTLFRYPMGEFSEYSLRFIENLGYKSIFWSYAYVDWKVDAQPDPTSSLTKLMTNLHGGAIYLLHAVSATNAKIMGDFVDQVHAAGYRIGSVEARLGTRKPPDIL